MPLKIPQPTAAELADLCLNHLAQNPDQLAEFMGITGLSPDSLRNSIGSASFQRGLIDYLVQNESLLVAVTSANSLSPDAVMRVWAKLNPAG